MSEDFEETNAGVKKKGDIEEVAEFAEKLEEGLEEEVEKDSIQDFDDWRPRQEDGKKDIEKKTVEAASLKRSSNEEESNGVRDLSEAGRKTVEAGKKLVKGENPNSELKEASKKMAKPVESGSRKMARGFEHQVYSKLMIKLNPYFFDAKEFSADLRARKDGSYSMEVNIPDSSKRSHLVDNLKSEEN
mgnify:CR=1 FL=1